MNEKILLAAIKIDDECIAIVPRAFRHNNIIHSLAKTGMKTPILGKQGFLTTTGRFVGRVEAKDIAQKAGQVKETEFSQLYTEDLW
jgi:hypothetical protein